MLCLIDLVFSVFCVEETAGYRTHISVFASPNVFNFTRRVKSTYFQTIILSAAMYFALPKETLQSTLAVLRGVGIFKLTFVAASFEEKVVLI